MTRFKGIKTSSPLLSVALLYSIHMTRFKGIKTNSLSDISFIVANSIHMTRFKGIKTVSSESIYFSVFAFNTYDPI